MLKAMTDKILNRIQTQKILLTICETLDYQHTEENHPSVL